MPSSRHPSWHSCPSSVYGGRIPGPAAAGEFIFICEEGDPHENIRRHDLLLQRLHNPRVPGTLVAGSRHPVRPLRLVAYTVYDHQPQLGIGRRTGRLLRRRSHADSDRGRILTAWLSSIPCGSKGRSGRRGGCGTRRLARGGERLQCRPRSAFPLAHRGGRSHRVLHRRLEKSHVHIGPGRLRGWLRVDFVPARDAYHRRAAFKHGFHKEY